MGEQNQVKHYFKKNLKTDVIDVEYSSEDEEITIEFRHKIVKGDTIYVDHMRMHASYVDELCRLLKEVVKT